MSKKLKETKEKKKERNKKKKKENENKKLCRKGNTLGTQVTLS